MSVLTILSVIITLTRSHFGLNPRAGIRLGWMRRIESHLGGLPRKQVFREDRIVPHTIVLHSSPLVRLFARDEHHHTIFDGIDIFIEFYLRKRSEAQDLDFGRKGAELHKSIDLEEKFYKEHVLKQEDRDEKANYRE